jgi:hypothetical protein
MFARPSELKTPAGAKAATAAARTAATEPTENISDIVPAALPNTASAKAAGAERWIRALRTVALLLLQGLPQGAAVQQAIHETIEHHGKQRAIIELGAGPVIAPALEIKPYIIQLSAALLMLTQRNTKIFQ